MRSRMFRTAALFALALPSLAGDGDYFGTWTRRARDPVGLKRDCPWVKGAFVSVAWSDLEPAPQQFDWKLFEDTIVPYVDAGLYVQLIVMVGPQSPRWIYEHGVPEVKTTPKLNPRGEPHRWTYPFYLDPDYKLYYHRLIREVAGHIDKLPPRLRRMIVCLQTAEGTTGDEGGYKGDPLDPRYELPEDQWSAFKFETWKLFDSLYRPKQPKIHLLINSGNKGQYHDWIMAHMPDTWRKAGNTGHGYQLNDELKMIEFLDPLINRRNVNGEFIRARSEMDETFKGWFREAPVWNQYWLNLWVLHFGIDIQQNAEDVLRDPRHAEGFAFVSKYGGHKDPAASPGAWCALRDGLDAAGLERFPAALFGEGAFSNRSPEKERGIARCLKIAAAFADRGALQGDPEKAMYRTMQNRDAKAMNDVGWNIWPGNYYRYLKQHDPNGTSVGYWRVGPKDQPYGRFARGFDVATGRNAMHFDLDDAFPAKRVKVRVVYLDRGTGSWALKYDGSRTAATVKNADTGRWKEITVELKDAQFRNAGPHGTDLTLENTSRENTLFHMIEVTK